MQFIETDAQSGADIYQITDGPRPVDNIYGEQPYSSRDGSRVALRYYDTPNHPGELAILDLNDGSQHTTIDTQPRFPAFHGWGDRLICQEAVGDEIILRSWDYHTLQREDLLTLPNGRGVYSYGTLSEDGKWYAVSVARPDGSWAVLLFEIETGEERVLAASDGTYLFKHEQFSRDGTNRVLIQANVLPEVKEVHLGTLELSGDAMVRLCCDQPHTPRPTGHEAWIGTTDRVFFSTDYDDSRSTNLFTVGVGDNESTVVIATAKRFGHVSVSRCGRYWIGDVFDEPGMPIYAGSLTSGTMRRLIVSGTVHDDNQWSHTHPYLTVDNSRLVYTSTRTGMPQVYAASIPDEFWTSLDES
jgi:hypothetical protein